MLRSAKALTAEEQMSDLGCFVPGIDCRVEGAGSGPLKGMTFAAKDLFDVAGFPTGGGNPDWAAYHPVPERHAWAVGTLLGAGATLIGKTITDEVSLGILGENPFHGTPVNSSAPGHVPGGSSSGSASAVAGGLCDTALGTDTGGSVRVPSSYCGLYGIRPTHGRLNLEGMMSQAPSSDTTGWFARDADTFARVSEVMLGEAAADTLPSKLLVASDAFGFADPGVADALAPLVNRLSTLLGESEEVVMAPPGLSVWAKAQRTLQPVEAYKTFEHWFDTKNPAMAYSVARGMVLASMTPAADVQWAQRMREEARARMNYLTRDGAVLCLPTTPSPAPRTGMSISEQMPFRDRIACLCSHGGLTGLPQVNLPGATLDGRPIGLSVVSARGSDATLIGLAKAMENAK